MAAPPPCRQSRLSLSQRSHLCRASVTAHVSLVRYPAHTRLPKYVPSAMWSGVVDVAVGLWAAPSRRLFAYRAPADRAILSPGSRCHNCPSVKACARVCGLL